MKKLLGLLFLCLLLRSPGASTASAAGPDPLQQDLSAAPAADRADPFTDSDDDIFSTNYERELLSRRVFKKSLPPLSRRELIRWTFRNANSNPLL